MKKVFVQIFSVVVLAGFVSTTTYAQGRIITIDYSNIVDTSPVTHSGMRVNEVIQYIGEATPSRIDPARLDTLRRNVTKWTQEVSSRKQKSEATRARLNEMLYWKLISRPEAQARYNEWVRYLREAQSELDLAKFQLSLFANAATRQQDEIKNLQAQIEPFLEPYAFLLEDALEAAEPRLRNSELIDLGALFPEGEAQPAWADLVRTRRYFVLSDGKGHARIFVPGETAPIAYQQHYGVLRHIIGWLWDSTKTEWTIEVFAYQNDLTTQTLKLNTVPHEIKSNAVPPPATGTVPVDLQALKEFFTKNLNFEGVYLNKEGTLVPYGSKTPDKPTFEGQPIELSDLAVAYRAVFYAGHGDAYISLDPSQFAEQVNVNFGGRLADTRIGWVVLRSDMRFKTLSENYDPVSGEDVSDRIQKVLPDYESQTYRKINSPGELPELEYTRFWFHPENITVSVNPRRTVMKITSPRFIGKAVREDPTHGNMAVSEEITPSWTKDTLAHLNRNYAEFAKLFPELRELDHVGRLLALFTWLKHRGLKLDLDSLLNVELPKCSTPRRKPQMLVGYRIIDGKFVTENLTTLSEDWASIRPRHGVDQNGARLQLPQTQEETLTLIAGSQKIGGSIGGGIDLNLTKAIGKSKRLPPSELDVNRRLIQSPTGEVIVNSSRTVVRANVKPIIQIEQPFLSGVKHTVSTVGPDSGIGPKSVRHAIAETFEEITSLNSSRGNIESVRRGPKSSLSEKSSRMTYYGNDNHPTTFIRYDNGTNLTYKLPVNGDRLIAERSASPNIVDETNAINNSLVQGELTSETWKRLPENTKVVAFDRLANNETIVLRNESGKYRLTRYKEGAAVESLDGDAGFAFMNNMSRERVSTGSTQSTSFIHASSEGDKFIIMVGKRRREVSLTEITDLMKNPMRRERSPIDELFDVSEGVQQEFVIYRDALARRPTRFGGAIIEGTFSDPAQLISLFRQRYPERRILVDDEISLAKRNLATMQPIKRASDIGLLIPENSFAITDFDLIKRIKNSLSTSGLVMIESPQKIQSIPNILLVSGHNDSNLIEYLTDLGDKGLLKDKVLLLNTCYAEGNPNLFHLLIQKYGAKAVFLHTERISDVALDPVLKNLGQMLQEIESRGETIHPAELFERAVERALKNPTLREQQRREILKLRRSALQISQLWFADEGNLG